MLRVIRVFRGILLVRAPRIAGARSSLGLMFPGMFGKFRVVFVLVFLQLDSYQMRRTVIPYTVVSNHPLTCLSEWMGVLSCIDIQPSWWVVLSNVEVNSSSYPPFLLDGPAANMVYLVVSTQASRVRGKWIIYSVAQIFYPVVVLL